MSEPDRLAPVHARMAAALRADGAATAPLYAWLRYQLGWAEADGSPGDHRTGKGVRPLLALVSCAAVGADPVAAVPVAAALELTHEFSLIHDDIEDGDRLRRGRAALWTLCGVAQGINAGDALFGIARREIGASPVTDVIVADLYRRYDTACVRLAEGQFLDLWFETRDRIDVDAYVDMVRRKTGALLAAAAAMGARAGGADPATADAMARFGEGLGVAFQIRDDVLGMWGDPVVTGKPCGADLLRRKKSLPVLLAWQSPALATEIEALFAANRPSAADALRVAEDMARAGCRDQATDMAQTRGRDALAALDGLSLADGPRRELVATVERAVDRDR
jgi:geranylgeranyl diphosphate synthase, type I